VGSWRVADSSPGFDFPSRSAISGAPSLRSLQGPALCAAEGRDAILRRLPHLFRSIKIPTPVLAKKRKDGASLIWVVSAKIKGKGSATRPRERMVV